MKYLIPMVIVLFIVGCTVEQNETKVPEAFFTCVKNSNSDAEVIKCRSLAPQPTERFRPLDFATSGPGDVKYQCDNEGLCWAVCANDTPSSSCGGLALACPANGPDACDYFCDGGGEPDVCYCQC